MESIEYSCFAAPSSTNNGVYNGHVANYEKGSEEKRERERESKIRTAYV
jgi:hypothetical protein